MVNRLTSAYFPIGLRTTSHQDKARASNGKIKHPCQGSHLISAYYHDNLNFRQPIYVMHRCRIGLFTKWRLMKCG